MKVYILQENYTEYVPEAGWDDNGSYDGYVERHDVIGVFTSLDDAVRKLVETCKMAEECDLDGDEYRDYDILVGDTETNQIEDVLPREYQELLVKISCMK